MITCTLEAMNPEVEKRLRIWLGKDEVQQLVRVGEAQAKKHATDALNAAIEAKDFPAKLDAANESLRKAQKYSNFLDVLKEFSHQKEPYTTSKLI